MLHELEGSWSHKLLMFSSQLEAKRGQDPVLDLLIEDTIHLEMTSGSHRFTHVLVIITRNKAPLLLAAEDELGLR